MPKVTEGHFIDPKILELTPHNTESIVCIAEGHRREKKLIIVSQIEEGTVHSYFKVMYNDQKLYQGNLLHKAVEAYNSRA